MKVGVLALQGDFAEHIRCLEGEGYGTKSIKSVADMDEIEGLVLPGGESTTQLALLNSSGLCDVVRVWLREGRPTFGTCAGMILMAEEIFGGRSDQYGLAGMAIGVLRNGFGRQVRSFEVDCDVSCVEGPPMHAVFIRAPAIQWTGPKVEVLAHVEYPLTDGSSKDVPVVVRTANLVACAFHPELQGDGRLYHCAFGDA